MVARVGFRRRREKTRARDLSHDARTIHARERGRDISD